MGGKDTTFGVRANAPDVFVARSRGQRKQACCLYGMPTSHPSFRAFFGGTCRHRQLCALSVSEPSLCGSFAGGAWHHRPQALWLSEYF